MVTEENLQNNQHGISTNAVEMSDTVLGLLIGETRYLVYMKEVSEVIQQPEFVPVPFTHAWFMGMINVHGNLYGVTDLGMYLSGESESFGFKSRILLVASNSKMHCGFIVPNLLGVRNLNEFEQDHAISEALRNGVTQVYRDREGMPWYALGLHMLTQEKKFLQIGN